NINMDCKTFFDVGKSDKYALKDFTFENVDVRESQGSLTPNPSPQGKGTLKVEGRELMGKPKGGSEAIIESIIEGTIIKSVIIK
ncbi:MAG: hypothetical protein J5610_05375, partial [Prevotella sp.]|nr:hypothetical protein [Prevotella sp.]